MGVLFGQVLSEEAYAQIMAHTASRGAFMRILPLTFPAPFDEWIPPLFIFPARAYFPIDTVVAQLAALYRTAPGIISLGLTLPFLEPSPSQLGASRHPVIGINPLPFPMAFNHGNAMHAMRSFGCRQILAP